MRWIHWQTSNMSQLLLRLRCTRACAWEDRYHRKLRGRFDAALAETPYSDIHDTDMAAFTFSDPMPYQPSFDTGEELHLLVAAPDDRILKAIATDLNRDPELPFGSMVTTVREARQIRADVGPPASTGQLSTASGIVVTMGDDSASPTYWTPREYSHDDLRGALLTNIQNVVENETDGDPPSELPFDSVEHNKTYGVKLDVTADYTITVLASNLTCDYTVRSHHHRQVLNTILNHGLGSKRAYGFGCLQTRNETYASGATEAKSNA